MLKQMLSNGQKVYQRILKRPVPHAVLSWRYFLPNQSTMVHLHRKTFIRAWHRFPRIVWFLIAIYSYTLWYLFYGWRQVFRVWNKHSQLLCEQNNIPRGQQLAHLMSLTYLHTIPPFFYYSYNLYKYNEDEWLNFVYTHELPHWHQMMSPDISQRSHHLMSNKKDFSIEMSTLGLPSIPTVYAIDRGEEFPFEHLFCKQSLFMKPEQGSRKEGCYAMTYNSKENQYLLEGNEIDKSLSKELIKTLIDNKTLKQSYLIQPLLENHSLFENHNQYEHLFTIRLVTMLNNNVPKTVSAIFELPVEGNFDHVMPITIEITQGVLQDMAEQYSFRYKKIKTQIHSLVDVKLPYWDDVISVAERAHQQFLDIFSIGWDLAITNDGVKLIEGNINYGVAAHQTGGPTLHLS